MREDQLSIHHTVLYPLNKNSVIDISPMNNESFPTIKPKLSQLLRRLSYARNNVSEIAESFLEDPSRRKFKYNDYHGDTNSEGLKLTYGIDDKGQTIFKTEKSSLVLYYSKTKVKTYLEIPPLAYPLITELQKIIPFGCENENEENWVSAFKMALNDVSWREQSWKLIVWVSDKNSKESDQMKLFKKVRKMANLNINFLGINVSTNCNDGCLKTLIKMKDVYKSSKSGNFVIQNFDEPVDNSLECLTDSFSKMSFQTIHQIPFYYYEAPIIYHVKS